MEVTTKVCSQCGQEKYGIYKDLCHNCYHKQYRQTPKGKTAIKRANKRHRQNNKEKLVERGHQDYQNNKEKILEQRKQWYLDNKNKKLEYEKQRQKNNLTHQTRFRNIMEDIIVKKITTSMPYIDIWLMYDTHYGSMDTNKNYLDTYLAWLNLPSHYSIMGGDLCEYSLTTGNTKYIAHSDKVDSEQIQWLKEVMSRYAYKHLVFLVGNHERRLFKNNPLGREYDIFKTLCKEAKIPYVRKQSAYLEIQLNKIKYLFFLVHGDGFSSYLSTTPLRSVINNRLVIDGTDFIIVGHSHHNLKDHENFGRIRKRNKINKAYPTKFIRPGSFLTHPEYARRERNVPEGNVILRLYADEKYSHAFRNLEELQLVSKGL